MRRPRLTERQDQVGILLCAGTPDKAIAAEMGVSERMVRRHIARLKKILGVQSRVGLALALYRLGS